jgi:hypothetical protein
MNPEQQKGMMSHEIELPAACAACGGPIVAKFTPTSARGVCLACRLITTLELTPAGGGVQVSQRPGGTA